MDGYYLFIQYTIDQYDTCKEQKRMKNPTETHLLQPGSLRDQHARY